jgi:hypothetical protein
MAIFSISDIIIAVTLIVNALALMSSTIKALALRNQSSRSNNDHNHSHNRQRDEDEVSLLPQDNSSSDDAQQAIQGRVVELMMGIRSLSTIVVFWNIFFFVLMIGVFGN